MKATSVWIALVCAGLAACSGDDGAQGPPGSAGPSGTDGTGTDGADGTDGSDGADGADGGTAVLSVVAKQGLDISPVPLTLDGLTGDEIEQVGRGSYLVNAIGACNDCHAQLVPNGPPVFLGGGTPFPLPAALGTQVFARNLTPDANTGLQLTEAEFIEALRTGKDFADPNTNQQLLVMPWFNLRWMTDQDLTAIYAYLQVIPAVNNPVSADMKNVVPPVAAPTQFDEGDVTRPLRDDTIPDPNNVLRGLAIQPLAEPAGFDTWDPDQQAAFGRGSYLVNTIGGCNDCHTNPMRDFSPGASYLKINTAQYLSGGGVFDVPPPLQPMLGQRRSMAANLTGTTNGYTASFSEFLGAITQGVHSADGSTPLGWPMTWMFLRNLTIDDLAAIYTYVTNVPKRSGGDDKETQWPARYCMANSDCDTNGGETCDTTNNECIGASCSTDADCGACQTCSSNACAAPSSSSNCVTQGI